MPETIEASEGSNLDTHKSIPVTLEYIVDPEERAMHEAVSNVIELKGSYYSGLVELYKNGHNSSAHVDTEKGPALSRINEQLIHNSVYVADSVSESFEKMKPHEYVDQFEQDPEKVQRRIAFLSEVIGQLDMADMSELRMQDILASLSKFCEDKTIFAHDGLESVSDMLNDELLSKHIIERRAVDMLLADSQMRDFLHDKGYRYNEDPEKDIAFHLGEFLWKLDENDREYVLDEYRRKEDVYLTDCKDLKDNIADIINRNEYCDFDMNESEESPDMQPQFA